MQLAMYKLYYSNYLGNFQTSVFNLFDLLKFILVFLGALNNYLMQEVQERLLANLE